MCTILVRDFEVLDYAENRVFHSLAYRCLDERHRTYSPDAKTRVDAYIAINCSKKMAFILIQTFFFFLFFCVFFYASMADLLLTYIISR